MGNEIVKKEENKIQINDGMNNIINEEMAGLSIQFPVLKVPAGGGLAFEVPGDDPNNPDLVKEFNAVILYHHPMLAYYKEKYTGGSQAPDCGSFDGVTGIGEPGGKCSECPLNCFGSGENGGKACKTKRRLFLLREGESIPVVLNLPTGSLKEFSKYIMFSVIGKNKRPNQVVTTFSLTKAQNNGGISYSKVICKVAYDLNSTEIEQIASLSEQVKAIAKRQEIADIDIDD